jgi:hypothetical protein
VCISTIVAAIVDRRRPGHSADKSQTIYKSSRIAQCEQAYTCHPLPMPIASRPWFVVCAFGYYCVLFNNWV